MIQYTSGYIVLDEGDNPNEIEEISGQNGTTHKQFLAIDLAGQRWGYVETNEYPEKWIQIFTKATNIGDGIEIYNQDSEDIMQFRTIQTNESIISQENNKNIDFQIATEDWRKKRLHTSLKDYFDICYYPSDKINYTKRNDNFFAPNILISNINSTDKTFTINLLERTNFNPLTTSLNHKWIGYVRTYPNNVSYNYISVENHVANKITYSLLSGPDLVNGTSYYIEFFNPYLNYNNLKANENSLIPEADSGETLSGKTISSSFLSNYFRKKNGTHILLGTIIFSNNTSGIYYASSTDLINWTLNTNPILEEDTSPIPYSRYFKIEQVIRLEDELTKSEELLGIGWTHYLDNGFYYQIPTYFKFNEDFDIIEEQTIFYIPGVEYAENRKVTFKNITKHRGKFRILYNSYENDDFKLFETKVECTLKDILKNNTSHQIFTSSVVHFSEDFETNSVLKGSCDSACYFNINEDLFILGGIIDENISIPFLTRNQRLYHIATSSEEDRWTWMLNGPYLCSPVDWGDFVDQNSFEWQQGDLGNTISINTIGKRIFLFTQGIYGINNGTLGIELKNYREYSKNEYIRNSVTISESFNEENLLTKDRAELVIVKGTNNINYFLSPSYKWANKTLIIQKLSQEGIVSIIPYSGDLVDNSPNIIVLNPTNNGNIRQIKFYSTGKEIYII